MKFRIPCCDVCDDQMILDWCATISTEETRWTCPNCGANVSWAEFFSRRRERTEQTTENPALAQLIEPAMRPRNLSDSVDGDFNIIIPCENCGAGIDIAHLERAGAILKD